MLRFIAFSLTVHILAIGAWYGQESRREEISGGRTLALALLAPAATATGSSMEAQIEHNRLDSASTPPQANPSRPAEIPAAGKQLTVPLAADYQQPVRARTSRTATAATGASVETLDTAARGSASTAPAAATPAANDRLARHAIQSAVSMALKANFRYPRIARRNGWEGTVTLALRVLPDGQLTDILVSSSSGHPVLDRAAIHTLQTASVPQTIQWLIDQAVDLVLPVEYRLLDS